MLFSDLVQVSFKQIYRNRRRYKGSIIGTALGIAGLITVMTIGDSVESSLGKNLEILGSATIVKAQWEVSRSKRWHHGQFYDNDLQALRRIPNVSSVSATIWSSSKVSFEKKSMTARIGGVEHVFFDTLYLPIDVGRRLTAFDVQQKSHACIIGRKVEQILFKGGSAIGNILLIQGIPFNIVGILGGAEDPDYLQTVLIPISTAKSKLQGMSEIRDLYIRSKDWDSVPRVSADVSKILKSNQTGYEDSLLVNYYPERIKSIQTIVFIFKFFLYAAIFVTLILGGIGIMNVMLSVVAERTREIGLRQAVGATEDMIILQFLFESFSVSMIGAILGILAAIVAVNGLEALLRISSGKMTLLISMMMSVVVGTLLGVLSGLIPAKKAGKLNAVDAMKFE
jgi:putative ABC transport system permease protein